MNAKYLFYDPQLVTKYPNPKNKNKKITILIIISIPDISPFDDALNEPIINQIIKK